MQSCLDFPLRAFLIAAPLMCQTSATPLAWR